MPRITNIQQRGGTAAQWASANSVLAAREIGLETDTGKMKWGDGTTAWNSLPYIVTPAHDYSNLWRSPYFLPETGGTNGLGTLYSGAEVIPAGNAARLDVRDHIGKDKFPILPGDKFVIEFTGKSILGGTLTPNVGVWMQTAAGVNGTTATTGWNSYDSASGAPVMIQGLTNGFARFRRTHTVSTAASGAAVPPRLGQLYFQLSQFSPYTDAWIVSDVSIRRLTLDQEIDTVSGSKVTGLTKSSVGLGSVDNTSDAAKPISTATQTALNGKANTSHTHASADVPAIDGGSNTGTVSKFQTRRATAASWNTSNPVLAAGEPGFETDTGLMKYGNGTSAWKNLGYYNGRPFDTVEMADDVAVEVDFDVNAITAPVGDRLTIPTHISPAGGQTTHPAVLFFPDGWGAPAKWKYWMAHTPYPAGNDDHEDPNIVVSNNGISWQAPVGLTNPLDDASGNPEFNSDVDLKMGPDGTMYLFWRFYDPNQVGSEEQLWYRSSRDGITWTPKVRYWVNNVATRKPLSPSLVFEDGAWTMWYVDAAPSPNVVMRMRSTGPTPEGGWGTPAQVNGIYYQPGKEPWHIYMLKQGGKYYGLLNDCVLDQNGSDGELLFLKSYDGNTFECSTSTCIPKYEENEHTRLYRSCMVPAIKNGVNGFRVWYVGWRDGPVWNIYRTFLSPGVLGGEETVPTTEGTILTPADWNNSGNFLLSVSGTKAKIEYDLTFRRSDTAPNFAVANTFVSMGTVVPSSMRVNTNTVTRYYDAWLAGGSAGYNLPVHVAINWYTGEALIRQQSGTTTQIASGVNWQVTGDLIVDASMVSAPAAAPPASTDTSGLPDVIEQAVLAGGTGDRAVIVPTLTGHASMLTDPTNRLQGADGSKFFTLFDARGRIASPLDNYYGYTSGHNSTQIWLVTGPTPAGPWTWRQAVRTLGTQTPLLNNNHLSSPEVVWWNNQVYLYYHGSKPAAGGVGQATALATSTDGVNFTEKPALALNCVYEEDRTRYYAVSTTYCRMVDAGGYLACVFQANTNLQNDQSANATPTSVGFATSRDGISWEISPVPLLQMTPGTSGPFGPGLAKIGGMWWLTAYVPADNKVNLYVSDRLEPGTFVKQAAWFAPPGGFDWVDSPIIKYLEGQWHLWYGATDSTYAKYGETFHAVLNWSI